MDWNMKESTWDLAELDEARGFPNVEETTIDVSRRFESSNKGEFSVDLKLGQVGDSSSSSSNNTWKDVVGGVSKVMVTSSSSPSKRARAINNGNQIVSCLVDGCNSDLSNCRDYHRRHKVCELHSKTPVVTIGGHKQRFCQQCSRFHSLEAFDEGKRSCRKRLDGHNRRRRKQPQQAAGEGVLGGKCGSFLSNYQQGTHHLLPFSSSHMYPSNAAVAHAAWNSDVRLHPHLVDHTQDLFLGSSSSSFLSSSYTETNSSSSKQLAFLEDHNSTGTPPGSSVCQTFLRATQSLPAAPLHGGGGDHHDSHCALSLLSSPQSGRGLSQISIMQQQQQPLGLSLHDHGLLETVDPVMVHHGSDHSPATMNEAAPPPFPFQWD